MTDTTPFSADGAGADGDPLEGLTRRAQHRLGPKTIHREMFGPPSPGVPPSDGFQKPGGRPVNARTHLLARRARRGETPKM